jgi:putative transposase
MTYIAYKYRLCPTGSQEPILCSWSDGCRFIFNLANEQVLLGLSRTKEDKVYVKSRDQQKELTVLREENTWLSDIPRHAMDSCLVRVDEAWQRHFAGLSGKPKFKKKTEWVSLTETDPRAFSVK